MEKIEISAKLRETLGKSSARRARKSKDIVPAVCYGRDSKPVHIEVSTSQIRKAIATPYKMNTIISLKISSGKENLEKMVLIKDVQKDVFGKKILHMDFIEVREDSPVKVKVPVKLVGKAKGVAEGGILQQIIRDLDMKCLPKDIPVSIEHDITELMIGGAVHVKDLKIPANATPLIDKDRTVAVVVEVKEEVTAAPVAAAATAEGAAAPAEGSAPAEGAGAAAPAAAPAKAATPDKAAAKPAGQEKK